MASQTVESEDDDLQPIKSRFKLHIAVDFGTDGTGTSHMSSDPFVDAQHLFIYLLLTVGLAYAYNNEVFVHSRWSSKKYGDAVKPKTVILLDENGNTLGFGADAKFKLISLYFTL